MKYSDKNEHLNDDHIDNVNKNDKAPEDAAKNSEQEKTSVDPDPDTTQDSSGNPEKKSGKIKPEEEVVPQQMEKEEVVPQSGEEVVTKDAEEEKEKVNDLEDEPEKVMSEEEGTPQEEEEVVTKDAEEEKEKVNDLEDEPEKVMSEEEVLPKESAEVKDQEKPAEEASPEEESVKASSEEESSSQKMDPEKKKSAVKVDTEKEALAQEKDTEKDTEKEKDKDKEEDKEKDKEKEKEAEKEKEKEAEKINYELLSKADLVKLLGDLINQKSFEEIRSSVDEIQEIYNRKQESELAEKMENFIAEGGLEQDFKPAGDPVDHQMDELMERYRSLKADHSKQLEDAKETNLAAKLEVLEEFRLLMEKQEGFDNTFRKFKQLQRRWFDIGIVPRQNVRDLWNSYNFFVDKFNDYVNISKELKVLDLKKNLEKKIELCNKTEALVNEPNIATAFKTLQTYHAQWREIGPVPREDKDVLWERFKEATSVINKAHQNYQAELKNTLFENLELKKGLCEKVEELAALELTHHKDWAEKTRELLKIQKDWKKIGYAPKKENNRIYARFRKACDAFFKKKAAFYAATFEQQKEIVQQKRDIIEEAEKLKDSTDWKRTTDQLIDLQKKWKESGPLPKKESDKLWNRFRSACDHFFNKKSEFFGGKDESYEENLKAKESLIEEVRNYKPTENTGKLTTVIEDFQNRFDEIGFVPVKDKDRIRDDFRDALNGLVDKLDTDEGTKALIQYRMKITAIVNSPRSDNKLRFERDKVMNKLQQLKNDIGVWENNIGFFKQTESAEETISDFQEKIEDSHSRIELLENKIRIIDEFDET